jgi:hypothetical protein
MGGGSHYGSGIRSAAFNLGRSGHSGHPDRHGRGGDPDRDHNKHWVDRDHDHDKHWVDRDHDHHKHWVDRDHDHDRWHHHRHWVFRDGRWIVIDLVGDDTGDYTHRQSVTAQQSLTHQPWRRIRAPA